MIKKCQCCNADPSQFNIKLGPLESNFRLMIVCRSCGNVVCWDVNNYNRQDESKALNGNASNG